MNKKIISLCILGGLLISLVGCSASSIQGGSFAVTKSGADGVNVSLAEFENIKNGMSLMEVESIIGGKGDMTAEAGEMGKPEYTAIYQYDGEGSLGANAMFTFQGGKLNSKGQTGLR